MRFTISEIRNFIKIHNIKPSDIFNREDLIKCPVVKKYLEAKKTEIKKAVTNAYQKRKRLERKFDKFREKAELKKIKRVKP